MSEPKRLWAAHCTARVDVVIVAATEREAMAMALVFATEEWENGGDDWDCDEVRELQPEGELPSDWAPYCIPWGGDNCLTIAEIRAEQKGGGDSDEREETP